MQGSVGSTMTDRTGTYLIQLQLANYNTRKSAEKKNEEEAQVQREQPGPAGDQYQGYLLSLDL